jgi:hypothetical protein
LHYAQRAVSLNAGGFRRLAFTKPANDKGKEKKQQVNPALRLPAGRYGQVKENVWLKGADHPMRNQKRNNGV